MSKLQLDQVTLVCVETREHELASLAVQDCLRVADFGAVLILTDKSLSFILDQTTTNHHHWDFHKVPDWPNKLGWSRSWWYDVPPLVKTSHTLNIQWDSWIVDPSMWSDDFLRYDYIGSPWWYKDGKNVGNGGFSLVSTRLKRYLRDRRQKYPCNTAVDDDLLCRTYRPALEDAGFVWAPEHIAHEFAFECCRPSATSKHFGFHACFNFPDVLDEERLLERARLMIRSPYITKNDYMWKAFCAKAPHIIEKLNPPLLMEAQLRFQHGTGELLKGA